MVQLTQPANELLMLFAFLYLKGPPDIRGESFDSRSACRSSQSSWTVWGILLGRSLQWTIGVRSLIPFFTFLVDNIGFYREFLPQHVPETLAYAVKHDYPTLISTTLLHFSQLPFISALKKLPPSLMVPRVHFKIKWIERISYLISDISEQARYHEAQTSHCRDSVLYITNLRYGTDNSCNLSSLASHYSICNTHVASLCVC